ncbi:MAG: family 78 glycoside hydrolase catalytic domain [Acidimicrobiales bacterium]
MTRTWTGAFIAPAAPPERGVAPYLRREFSVDDGLVQATLHVTAIGLVEAQLNGTVVGDEVLAPGWTSYDHRLAVSRHDVTDLVVAGDNALGLIVGEGWAVGRLGWDVEHEQVWAERPSAFVELDLDYGDRVETIVSDTTWLAGTGAVLANSLYDGETHDARLEPDGWSAPGFADAGWGAVEEVPWDLGTLITTTAPPIRRIEEVPAKEVLRTAAGRTVVDFGQNLVGWVRLTVAGEAGTTITLHTSETLIHGEPDFETNRTAETTDRYTLRGGGPETWEPRFTFHGFRYVDVEGWPGELDASALTAVVIHSDMRRIGWFECSNDLLNQLHENVVWSMRGNFVGVPTDCPQRDERLGWTGDINAFASTASFLYDVRGVLGSWLEDLAAEQAEFGGVPFTVPAAGITQGAGPTALWGDVAVSLPAHLYAVYGDPDVLARQYASMTAFIDQVAALLDEHGVWSDGFQFGDWLDPDAPAGNPGASKVDRYLVATAFLARTTAEMADAAHVLGHTDDAARYRSLHQRVRDGFRREWITPAGRLADHSATGHALAICFGLFDPNEEARAGDRLARLVVQAGYRISTGFAGTPYVTEALSRTGHLDTAYALLLETECPSFLYPITMGATTIWERWDAIRPDGTLHSTGMTSLNHYALGAVATWMHQVVAGLTPVEPGYRSMRIAPQPGGGLTHASVTHDTPHGRVRVGWQLHPDGRFVVEASIPDGTSAEVVLPRHPDGLVEPVGPGDHRWEYETPVATAALTLDSTFRDLLDHPTEWAAVMAAVQEHFNIDLAASDDMLDQTLRSGMERAGAASPKLEADLRAALAHLA